MTSHLMITLPDETVAFLKKLRGDRLIKSVSDELNRAFQEKWMADDTDTLDRIERRATQQLEDIRVRKAAAAERNRKEIERMQIEFKKLTPIQRTILDTIRTDRLRGRYSDHSLTDRLNTTARLNITVKEFQFYIDSARHESEEKRKKQMGAQTE